MTKFPCSICRTRLEFPTGMSAGQRIRCPACNQIIRIPETNLVASRIAAIEKEPDYPSPDQDEPVVVEQKVEKEKPRVKPKIQVVSEDEEEDQPKPKPARHDDSEVERPKVKKKKKKKGKKAPHSIWRDQSNLLVFGIGLCLMGAVVIIAAWTTDLDEKILVTVVGLIPVLAGIGIGKGWVIPSNDSEANSGSSDDVNDDGVDLEDSD